KGMSPLWWNRRMHWGVTISSWKRLKKNNNRKSRRSSSIFAGHNHRNIGDRVARIIQQERSVMSTEGEVIYQNEGFRNSIGTVHDDGKRKWIYPRKPKGKFYNYRTYLSYVLLAILFAGPFIKIDGQPLLLLNIFENKFVIFGAVFWPQDTYLLIFMLLIFMVFIIMFTAVFGRVFCGWFCPQ